VLIFNADTTLKIFLRIFRYNFLECVYNFSKFLYNFITFSHFYTNWNISQKIYIFSQNFSYMLIMKYHKIFKIFCKYNFWWNVTKSKKNLKILFKNYEMRNFRIFQNSLIWEILREDVTFRIFLNISEKCSNSYKNYEKNFH